MNTQNASSHSSPNTKKDDKTDDAPLDAQLVSYVELLPEHEDWITSRIKIVPTEKWSYVQFAWEFLRLNNQFIKGTDNALNKSEAHRTSFAKEWGLKRFKHHSEAFKKGKKPRFTSGAVSYWSNSAEEHGKYRTVDRRLRYGDAFIQFDLRNAVLFPDRSIKAQLRSAEKILKRLQRKLEGDPTLKHGPRPNISGKRSKASLVCYYKFYVEAKLKGATNYSAFLEHMPSVFSPDQKIRRASFTKDDQDILRRSADKAMREAKDLIESEYLMLALFEDKKKLRVFTRNFFIHNSR